MDDSVTHKDIESINSRLYELENRAVKEGWFMKPVIVRVSGMLLAGLGIAFVLYLIDVPRRVEKAQSLSSAYSDHAINLHLKAEHEVLLSRLHIIEECIKDNRKENEALREDQRETREKVVRIQATLGGSK